MGSLKKTGRALRRLRKAIAAMDPHKVYKVGPVTLTGAKWKEAAMPKE